MTSHSKTLFPMRPQLMPGMSLSLCMSLSWRLKSPEAAELAMMISFRRWGVDGFSAGFGSCSRRTRKASDRDAGSGISRLKLNSCGLADHIPHGSGSFVGDIRCQYFLFMQKLGQSRKS